ncbi:MAG: helical backbone metal receptor [Bryobacteraceae bacterium]
MRFLAILLTTCASLLAQPQRIISTSPSITETLFALGLGSRVVGVSNYCHFPADVEQLPKVGTYLKPNVEVIARLKPDLVVVQRLPTSVREQLQGLSIQVSEVDSGDLKQNLDSIVAIGKATSSEAAARVLIDRINGQLATMRNATAGKPPRSVAFIVGRTPGKLEGLVVVGGGSYLSELLTIAGGRNVFADSSQAYVKTSLESLLRRNPEILIDMGEMAETVGVTENAKRTVVNLWGTRPNLKAVRERRVYAVASDIFVVPGPRMLDAAQAFAEMLGRK